MFSVVFLSQIFVTQLLCEQIRNHESIDRLVEKLGSPKFNEREMATKQLLNKWPEARPALQRALDSPKLETVRRARLILNKFDQHFRDWTTKRLEQSIEEGEIDQTIELVASWPKGTYEKCCWQMARKLTFHLVKARKNAERYGIDVKLRRDRDVMPAVVSGKVVTKDLKGRNRILFGSGQVC